MGPRSYTFPPWHHRAHTLSPFKAPSQPAKTEMHDADPSQPHVVVMPFQWCCLGGPELQTEGPSRHLPPQHTPHPPTTCGAAWGHRPLA